MSRIQPRPSKCPEPLCTFKVLPFSSRSLGSRQRALPRFHRSYGLMRQTNTLLSSSVVPISTGLCSLSSLTAARCPFPTLSLRIILCVLGPLPRLLLWCFYSFLPTRLRPFRRHEPVGALQLTYYRNFSMHEFSGLQSFSNVQARRVARHPDCTYRSVPFETPGSRGLYVHAYLSSLPPRAVDMLAVRIEQLTAWGLSPH